MSKFIVELTVGRDVEVEADDFDEYEGNLFIYSGGVKTALFAKGEWSLILKAPDPITKAAVEPLPSGPRKALLEVYVPSDDTFRTPQVWEYMSYIPTHLTVVDGDGKEWNHTGDAWVREDGLRTTCSWTGPYTEVIE
ncbi:hypothetical protein SEA_DUBLIN_50 [Mycobacterium phage Dublin]|nr:hypothetical protein SEA_DUBLIN_50 [Mycobacterium phage Dublin]QGJ92225.1 hypothetical protein SEA_MARYSWELL_50 [Mycobacterium phage MarysWell]